MFAHTTPRPPPQQSSQQPTTRRRLDDDAIENAEKIKEERDELKEELRRCQSDMEWKDRLLQFKEDHIADANELVAEANERVEKAKKQLARAKEREEKAQEQFGKYLAKAIKSEECVIAVRKEMEDQSKKHRAQIALYKKQIDHLQEQIASHHYEDDTSSNDDDDTSTMSHQDDEEEEDSDDDDDESTFVAERMIQQLMTLFYCKSFIQAHVTQHNQELNEDQQPLTFAQGIARYQHALLEKKNNKMVLSQLGREILKDVETQMTEDEIVAALQEVDVHAVLCKFVHDDEEQEHSSM